MIVLDVYPAKVETPSQGAIEKVRAVVEAESGRLLLFGEGPVLLDAIEVVNVQDSIPLRGNAVVLTGPNGDTWRVIRLSGQGGCCGSPAARLRTFPPASLLALASA